MEVDKKEIFTVLISDERYARWTEPRDLEHLHALSDFVFEYVYRNKLKINDVMAYLAAIEESLHEVTADGCEFDEDKPSLLHDAEDVFSIGDHIVTGEEITTVASS